MPAQPSFSFKPPPLDSIINPRELETIHTIRYWGLGWSGTDRLAQEGDSEDALISAKSGIYVAIFCSCVAIDRRNLPQAEPQSTSFTLWLDLARCASFTWSTEFAEELSYCKLTLKPENGR
jgi:hypothetical protein